MNKKISPTLALPNIDVMHPPIYGSSQEELSRDYAELKRLIKNRGLLDKQPIYYTFRIALLFGLLVLGLIFLLVVHIFLLQLLDAVYLAVVFTQIGLLGHDARHRQMFKRAWKHDFVSLVGGTLLLGMSYTWWIEKHNHHHSHPNQVNMDPDIEIAFLEFTGTEDLEHLSKFRRLLVKYQAFIFLPALMLVAMDLQRNSVEFLIRKKAKYQAVEWILLIAHFVLYFAFVFFCLPF
jgi:fatty acid desaturase